jgi:hypothetical protein
MKPTLHTALRERATRLLRSLEAHSYAIGQHPVEAHIRTCYETGNGVPYSAHARARNATLDEYLRPSHTHVLWIDADIVSYPPDLISRLLAPFTAGIVAPLPLIEDTDRFYDVVGFLDIHGKRLPIYPPYLSGDSDLVPMRAVGTCYLIPASIYRDGARYEPTTGHTEHYTVMAAAAEAGMRISCLRSLTIAHADLPKYGEAWHSLETGE